MENIFGQVKILLAVILIVAIFVEAILEAGKPLFALFKDKAIRTTLFLLVGAVLGSLTAWGMDLRLENYFNFLPLVVPAFISYILIGCAAGAGGSRFWHAVLGFLGSVKLPTIENPPTVG